MAVIVAQGLTGSEQPNLQLGELDFHQIRRNLKQYLSGSGVFTDYDFEGSAMSSLLDLLSYNASLYGYYANMIANESFLDTAQKEESIKSLIKPLAYLPVSSRSARAEITVNGTDKIINEDDLFLGQGLKWAPSQEYYINGNTTIEIIQGNNKDQVIGQYDSTNPHMKFEVPSDFVDTTTLKVYVDEGSGFNEWKNVDNVVGNITGITAGARTFFLTTSSEGRYAVYFGDDFIGKKPQNLSTVRMNFLETAGEDGNGVVVFTSGTNGVSVVNTAVAGVGGAFQEDIESVRKFAPLNFQTQGRYVTSSDFIVGLRQEQLGVVSNVWGGEENDPPNYGRVYVSAIGEDSSLLTETMKNRIINVMKSKGVVSILPEFVDPVPINILISGNVYFDPTRSPNPMDVVQSRITNYINSYQKSSFDENFNYSLFTINLLSIDEGIVGETLDVYIERDYVLGSGDSLTSITLPFNNTLADPGGLPGTVIETPQPIRVNYEGTPIFVYLIDDGYGGIRMYKLDDSSFLQEVGSVNYSNGRVQIDDLNAIESFTIRARPRSNTIISKGPLVLTTKDGGVGVIST
tara:strand:+ start:1109 stop:2830 length:1722 start_codon:yes stop_codon:yes gene_type:complete